MRIFKNANLIDLSTEIGRRKFIGAIQHNWDTIRDIGNLALRMGVQEFTSGSNFPDEVAAAIAKYHIDITEIERSYEAAFDIVDLRGSNASSFKIRDVQSGLSFARVRDGEKALIYGISGNAVEVELDLYGAALEWSRKWFMDQEWWTIEDNAVEFRRKWWESRAIVFWDLIQSLTDGTAYNVPYDTVGATAVAKDINTINAGCLELITAHLDTGLGVNASTQMVIFVPLANKPRVERALLGTFGAANPAGDRISYNISAFYTAGLDWVRPLDVVAGTDWTGHGSDNQPPLGYLCIPGRKNKLGERMDLTILSETDILAFAEKTAGWGRYGGAISEAQWRRLLGT